MSDDQPSKTDVAAALKRLRAFSSNKTCFDCGAKNPTWASVTYGVFLCIDCSAVHRSLGVHLTFIRSTQLDTNWTWLQLRAMQLGGNAHAAEFFRQHGCTTTDAQQKYNSRAAQLYKDKLQQMAIQSMKVHGSKLHLDTAASEEHAEEKLALEKKNNQLVDFFEANTASTPSTVWQHDRENQDAADKKKKNGNSTYNEDGQGPSVATNLDDVASPESTSLTGKSSIASRKITGNKPAKKGKLGGQRVDVNFDDMEKEAEEAEKRRQESLASRALFEVAKNADDDRSKLSTRLAYQDVEGDRKKEEDRIRKSDPKKAEQLERLGMGIGARGKISHSILSDMTTIEQGRVGNGRSDTRSYGAMDRQPAAEDEWDRLEDQPRGYSSRYESKSAYSRDEPRDRDRSSMEDMSRGTGRLNLNDRSSSGGNLSSYQDDYRPSGTAKADSSAKVTKKTDTVTAAGDDAQKKFGNAKSISSDMYFGNSTSGSDWETKSSTANRFEGKSSISSADYFGTGTGTGANSSGSSAGRANYTSMNIQAPDLEDIKEGVKQGITKVAGRLSSMASSVMTNIQDRYG